MNYMIIKNVRVGENVIRNDKTAKIVISLNILKQYWEHQSLSTINNYYNYTL